MPGFKGKDNKSNIKANKVEEYTEAKELHRLGVESHKNGDTKKAEILYKKAIGYNYFNEGLVANLGIILKNKGALHEAELLYLKGIEERYDFSICNINLARLYRQSGKLTRGIEILEKAICRKPNEANYYLELGEIYGESGLTEKGILAFQQCIKLNSKIAKAYIGLGVLYNQRAMYNEAIEANKKALKYEPENDKIYLNISTIYKNLGQIKNSIIAVKRALSIGGDNADAYFKLGGFLNEDGEYDRAIEAIEKALICGYDQGDCKFALASSKFGMGKYNEARVMLEEMYAETKEKSNRRLTLKIAIESVKTKIRLEKNNNVQDQYRDEEMVIKSQRDISQSLINELNAVNIKPLVETQDSRYGNGKCSNFKLLDTKTPEIQKVKDDIYRLIEDKMNMTPYNLEYDSFLNVFSKGAGQPAHDHIRSYDKVFDQSKNKYSLVYYIDIGDQQCKHPGILNLHKPEEKIKPTNGLIVIIPATRFHSVHYEGERKRMMIGVNFYAFPRMI